MSVCVEREWKGLDNREVVLCHIYKYTWYKTMNEHLY